MVTYRCPRQQQRDVTHTGYFASCEQRGPDKKKVTFVSTSTILFTNTYTHMNVEIDGSTSTPSPPNLQRNTTPHEKLEVLWRVRKIELADQKFVIKMLTLVGGGGGVWEPSLLSLVFLRISFMVMWTLCNCETRTYLEEATVSAFLPSLGPGSLMCTEIGCSAPWISRSPCFSWSLPLKEKRKKKCKLCGVRPAATWLGPEMSYSNVDSNCHRPCCDMGPPSFPSKHCPLDSVTTYTKAEISQRTCSIQYPERITIAGRVMIPEQTENRSTLVIGCAGWGWWVQQ